MTKVIGSVAVKDISRDCDDVGRVSLYGVVDGEWIFITTYYTDDIQVEPAMLVDHTIEEARQMVANVRRENLDMLLQDEEDDRPSYDWEG